jgi:hypothetical protein
MSRFIATESVLDEVLWPHWPGFEEAFHPVLPEEPAWVEEIDERMVLHQQFRRQPSTRTSIAKWNSWNWV